MILLDTTILIYAVGYEHSLRRPSRDLMALIRDGDVRASTTTEVIQEFAHVRARRRPQQEAAARAMEYARGLTPLVRTQEDDLFDGLVLFQDSSDLGPFDSVLAAVALRRGCALASADRSFRQVSDLVHLDPSSSGFLDDVRAAG